MLFQRVFVFVCLYVVAFVFRSCCVSWLRWASCLEKCFSRFSLYARACCSYVSQYAWILSFSCSSSWMVSSSVLVPSPIVCVSKQIFDDLDGVWHRDVGSFLVLIHSLNFSGCQWCACQVWEWMGGFSCFPVLGASSIFGSKKQKLFAPCRFYPFLLQQTKVEVEGKTAEAVFYQFMCYCQNPGSMPSTAITAAKTQILLSSNLTSKRRSCWAEATQRRIRPYCPRVQGSAMKLVEHPPRAGDENHHHAGTLHHSCSMLYWIQGCLGCSLPDLFIEGWQGQHQLKWTWDISTVEPWNCVTQQNKFVFFHVQFHVCIHSTCSCSLLVCQANNCFQSF